MSSPEQSNRLIYVPLSLPPPERTPIGNREKALSKWVCGSPLENVRPGIVPRNIVGEGVGRPIRDSPGRWDPHPPPLPPIQTCITLCSADGSDFKVYRDKSHSHSFPPPLSSVVFTFIFTVLVTPEKWRFARESEMSSGSRFYEPALYLSPFSVLRGGGGLEVNISSSSLSENFLLS